MTDDRSERLRRRRNRSTESTEYRGGTDRARPSQPSDTSGPSGADPGTNGSDDGGETVSIKEEQTGTYMYLPETQTRELRRLYNVLKAEYEFEYDEEFEKNRHFYPLIVQYGLEGLEGIDASEIRARLQRIV